MSTMTENAELLELAREFAEGELAPYEAERDAAGTLPDDLFATLGEMGFFGMVVPEEAGGLGLDAVTFHALLAILAEADPSVALVVAEHGAAAATVAAAGADAELVGALAMGEALAPSAVLEGGADEVGPIFATTLDGGAVSGTKRMVVNGSRASRFLVVAESHGAPVLTSVDGAASGLSRGERATTMGLSALDLSTVAFEDAAAERVAGDPVGALVARRRAGVAAVAVGVARSSLRHAVRYAEERAQFGRSLSRFDAIQAKLADVTSRTAAAESLVRAVAADLDAGAPSTGRAASAKIVASEAAMFAADEAVQIFGGYGYMRDYPVEKRMRDAKGLEVLAGTNEALRRVVTQDLLAGFRAS